MIENTNSELFKRIEAEIKNYVSGSVEVSEGVQFSQHKTIRRIYKFRSRDLDGTKLNSDLSYNYYFDVISPRADSEIKNLRFDTKHILLFSQNPMKDFAAVFVANASLKSWMAENGEDDKLKASVEEFVANGNIGFKRVTGGYETIDPLNTIITNQMAETVDDTDIIERHEMSASQILGMSEWDQEEIEDVIKEEKNKSFKSTTETTPTPATAPKYEIYEFTGEVSDKEFNQAKGKEDGDENKYFLAKIIVAGLREGGSSRRYVLFADKIKGDMSDHYIYAHRGRYERRFWRVGMYELLFDHQIRANEIANQLATGLEWASKVVFKSSNSRVMQNIRADLDNGDVIITDNLDQLHVRMQGMDQLIADWNRLMEDADRVSNSFEIIRGENLPSGTPFRLGALMDQNAGMLFVLLRQKLALPYKRVFKQWVLPSLLKDMKGKEVFNLVGETEVLDQLRDIMVNKWYVDNLVQIGPHTKEIAEALKADKLDSLREVDPIIENSKELWDGVLPRIFVTITGENSDIADQVTDLMTLIPLEVDPVRRAWMLDLVYKIRNIPVPPKIEEPVQTEASAGNGTPAPVKSSNTSRPQTPAIQ